MNEWTSTARRFGFWSALCVPVLGICYMACGAVGLFVRGDITLEALLPAEPYVTICRFLMLVLIGDLVVLIAAVHAYAPLDRRTYSRTALAFAIIFAVIAGVNTFLLVTIARHAESEPGLALLFSFHWPSVNLFLDLFAWGPVLGLTLLFAAPVFRFGKLQVAIRTGLMLAGVLCVGNTLCFVAGDVRFSVLGIVGYDFVLPIACSLMAVRFSRATYPTLAPDETVLKSR